MGHLHSAPERLVPGCKFWSSGAPTSNLYPNANKKEKKLRLGKYIQGYTRGILLKDRYIFNWILFKYKIQFEIFLFEIKKNLVNTDELSQKWNC
jgi:hypothetical protein